MPANHHPPRLTIEMVIPEYERLIRSKIAKLANGDDFEECFQHLILTMITPSETLGTNYLDRYDPTRSSVANYLSMFCAQQLSKRNQRLKAQPETVPLVYGTVDELQDFTGQVVAEETIPAEEWEPEIDADTVKTPDDLRKILRGTPFLSVSSCSPSGEPRSTYRVLELMVWGGLSAREVGERLGVTTAEIYRRIKLLRADPRIRALRDGRLAPP